MDKIFQTHEQHKHRLETRGLIVEDYNLFVHALQQDTYYNLINGYKKYFLASTSPEVFLKGITFEQIYSLYLFDQKMRASFLFYLLKVEQNIKSLLAYDFSQKYGHKHNDYLDIMNFDNTSNKKISDAAHVISSIKKDVENAARKKHCSVIHYLAKYQYIPLWVLVNILSFGRINAFYSSMKLSDQQNIANNFKLSASHFRGFIFFIADFRNRCAHGERIYTAKNITRNLKIIPDTNFHSKLNIPKNNKGNYINGKNNILALLIALKLFLLEENFKKILQYFNSETKKLNKALPENIMNNIKNELGILDVNLDELK